MGRVAAKSFGINYKALYTSLRLFIRKARRKFFKSTSKNYYRDLKAYSQSFRLQQPKRAMRYIPRAYGLIIVPAAFYTLKYLPSLINYRLAASNQLNSALPSALADSRELVTDVEKAECAEKQYQKDIKSAFLGPLNV